mmetsp:Transcript_47338/g.143355  ORF Transcript_47338/g.143355 Transcript_47338/m.143355 type:complete len:100 (+) Transcript_47338:1570-1869(+)
MRNPTHFMKSKTAISQGKCSDLQKAFWGGGAYQQKNSLHLKVSISKPQKSKISSAIAGKRYCSRKKAHRPQNPIISELPVRRTLVRSHNQRFASMEYPS